MDRSYHCLRRRRAWFNLPSLGKAHRRIITWSAVVGPPKIRRRQIVVAGIPRRTAGFWTTRMRNRPDTNWTAPAALAESPEEWRRGANAEAGRKVSRGACPAGCILWAFAPARASCSYLAAGSESARHSRPAVDQQHYPKPPPSRPHRLRLVISGLSPFHSALRYRFLLSNLNTTVFIPTRAGSFTTR